ncbi:hypothetical protein HAX54_004484, partial [Datura stramonium]|nr:hypothetical protein [Datura stramonium]
RSVTGRPGPGATHLSRRVQDYDNMLLPNFREPMKDPLHTPNALEAEEVGWFESYPRLISGTQEAVSLGVGCMGSRGSVTVDRGLGGLLKGCFDSCCAPPHGHKVSAEKFGTRLHWLGKLLCEEMSRVMRRIRCGGICSSQHNELITAQELNVPPLAPKLMLGVGTLNAIFRLHQLVALLYMMHRIPTSFGKYGSTGINGPQSRIPPFCKDPPFLSNFRISIEGYLRAQMLGLSKLRQEKELSKCSCIIGDMPMSREAFRRVAEESPLT